MIDLKDIFLLYVLRRKRITSFLHYFCQHVYTENEKAVNPYYLKLLNRLEEFEKQYQIKIYSTSFNTILCNKFIYFLQHERGVSHNTVHAYFRSLKSTLYRIRGMGYDIFLDDIFALNLREHETDAVYLTMEEVERLLSLNLEPSVAQVRDLFVFACCTALRYSDLTRLTEENFKDNCIYVRTKKAEAPVIIPIHRFVKQIIEKNGGYSFLKYDKTKQNFNATIKRICRNAGINEKIVIEKIQEGQFTRTVYEKWELVASHTGRRTGATNMHLSGISPYSIMLITGHKSEFTFRLYIRISRQENANYLKQHPFFAEGQTVRLEKAIIREAA